MKFLIAVFLLSVFCHNPVAAQFPVQANLQIVPPYSPYLSDYAGGNGDRLVLTLLLNESPTVLLPVRLRFRISGTPLFGRDASFLLPNPIELQGGIPVRFSGADLTSYFNHWNMGLQTDRLPDGLYNFEFEALDTQRGIAVSDKARASLWIVLGKAPQLNFPVQNSIVQALEPQNVSFSWVARSLSPNSTFQTSYRFTLVEIVPSDREANEAILTTKPLYEEEITGTGLLYGISHPPLEKGRRYAWRVRAVDGSGRDYFENSGFSEVYSFIYGTDCGIPVNIEATPVSPTEVRWKGTGGSGNSAAVLRYRKADGDKEWKSQNQLLASSGIIDLKVTGLDADTEYEYELGALCSNCRVKQSEKISGRVRTPKADSAAGDFECGRVPTLDYAEIEDMTPYPGEFKKGDTVRAADSELILTSVRNTGPGRITGRAVVFIPAFKNAGFTAEFDNVLINKYKRLVKMEGNAMYIRSVGVGEESASQMAAKIGKWIDRLDTNFTDTYFGLMELGKIESKARGFLEKANLDDSLKRNLGELLDFLEDAVEDFRQAVQDKDPERIKDAKKRVNIALRLLRKFVRKPDEEIDVSQLVKGLVPTALSDCDKIHTIKAGENLFKIAQLYWNDMKPIMDYGDDATIMEDYVPDIIRWNGLRDYEIIEGKSLIVKRCHDCYTVTKGDGLFAISKKYLFTTVEDIRRWNPELKNDTDIKEGQKLCMMNSRADGGGKLTNKITLYSDYLSKKIFQMVNLNTNAEIWDKALDFASRKYDNPTYAQEKFNRTIVGETSSDAPLGSKEIWGVVFDEETQRYIHTRLWSSNSNVIIIGESENPSPSPNILDAIFTILEEEGLIMTESENKLDRVIVFYIDLATDIYPITATAKVSYAVFGGALTGKAHNPLYDLVNLYTNDQYYETAANEDAINLTSGSIGVVMDYYDFLKACDKVMPNIPRFGLYYRAFKAGKKTYDACKKTLDYYKNNHDDKMKQKK